MIAEIKASAGESIPVRFAGTTWGANQKMMGTVAFFQDVREIKRLERELVNSERLAAVGTTSGETQGLVIIDVDGTSRRIADNLGMTALLDAHRAALAEGETLSADEATELPEDVRAVVHGIFRHRLKLSYDASADGVSANDVIDEILKVVAVA